MISVIAGCGGGGSSNGGADGATATGGAAGTGAADGAVTSGGMAGTAGAGGTSGVAGMSGADAGAKTSDGPKAIDGASATMALPAMGDHFCQHTQVEAATWTAGWQRHCVMTVAAMPPLTMMQKMSADYACTFYDAKATVVADCPRSEVLAYCTTTSLIAGAKQYTLIQKSTINPDVESIAVNALGHGCFPGQIFDVDGKPLDRKCIGTVTAKVNGMAMTFDKQLTCTYKADATRAEYFISADTAEGNRLQLAIKKEAGAVVWDTDITAGTAKGAGYLEGANNAFVFPVNADARTVAATTFADKGAGLVGTFSLGDYKNGSGVVRTITDGTIDIKIVAP